MRCLATAFIFFAACAPAWALDSDDINNWVAAMVPLESWADANEGVLDENFGIHLGGAGDGAPLTKEQIERMRSPFSNVVRAIRQEGLAADPEIIVRAHEFRNLEDWARTGDRIIRAYMAIQLEGAGPDPEDVAARRAEIDASPYLTPEQKAERKQQLETVLLTIEIMSDAPRRDIETVKKNKAALDAVMGQ